MNVRVSRIDHLQIAAPEGCESAAREFYGSLLGMPEIEKPEPLRSRGACWFQCGDQQVHIGVEQNFRAAKKSPSRLRHQPSRRSALGPPHSRNKGHRRQRHPRHSPLPRRRPLGQPPRIRRNSISPAYRLGRVTRPLAPQVRPGIAHFYPSRFSPTPPNP
jgi:hypothetical protein